jgi:peptide/nickel transport system substrate-binding protein
MNRWEELQLAAFEGKIGRRDFMRRAAALGITTTLASGLLASAGYADDTPKKGGTLKLGMEGGSPSDSLDPRSYADSVMIAARSPCATAWSSSPPTASRRASCSRAGT